MVMAKMAGGGPVCGGGGMWADGLDGGGNDLDEQRRRAMDDALNSLTAAVTKKLTSLAAGVTGSPQYWAQIRKNLKGTYTTLHFVAYITLMV